MGEGRKQVGSRCCLLHNWTGRKMGGAERSVALRYVGSSPLCRAGEPGIRRRGNMNGQKKNEEKPRKWTVCRILGGMRRGRGEIRLILHPDQGANTLPQGRNRWFKGHKHDHNGTTPRQIRGRKPSIDRQCYLPSSPRVSRSVTTDPMTQAEAALPRIASHR